MSTDTQQWSLDELGRESEPREFEVTKERTIAYAEATNDAHPAHLSGELAPPVFAIVPVFEVIAPQIVGKARIGDIRHCFCDTDLAAERLGFRARRDFGEGLAELALWVGQQTAQDRVGQMRAELDARGLVA